MAGAMLGQTKSVTYTSEELRRLNNSNLNIKREVRKQLFANKIWKPRRRPYDVNQGVNPANLRSLPKNNTTSPVRTGLNLSTVNLCSVRNKVDDLLDSVIEANYDVCFTTETWLRANDPVDISVTHCLNNDIFNFIHFPRDSVNRGGGIGVLFKKTLKVETLKHHIFSTFEMCLCRITSRKTSLLVLCLYRPPQSSKNGNTITHFLKEFNEFASSVLATYTDKRLIILGDFNIHVNKTNDNNTQAFFQLLGTYGWQQHVEGRTHTSGNTLDLVITSDHSDLRITNVTTQNFISDHAFVSFRVNIPPVEAEKIQIHARPYSKIDPTAFGMDLECLVNRLLELSAELDTDTLVTQYHKELCHLLDTHAPIKHLSITPRLRVAWFDQNAKELKRNARRAEKIWIRSGSHTDLQNLKDARRLYRCKLHENKTMHFKKAITAAKGNSRQLYAITSGLMGKKKDNTLPSTQDDTALANEFAEYFMSKIITIRSSLENFSRYRPTAYTNSQLTSLTSVSEDTVNKLIRTSKPTTCPSDPMPSSLVKDNADIITPLITCIVNKSIMSGVFPDQWKTASVTPLLKKEGLDPIMNNFRPVSNLSYTSKITEKCVISQLNHYLTINKLDSGHQSAYKESFSTETAICALMNRLLWAMECGKSSILVALDLSAAFDTVDHSILIDVLNQTYGLSQDALRWFQSYLLDRKLHVKINQDHSKIHTFNFSVPQGSCLGPVLFNIYCSSIIECVDNNQHISGYADDHCLYDCFTPGTTTEESDCIKRIETSLCCISDWMSSNRLKMNASKTEATIFSSKQKHDDIKTTLIKVAGDSVPVSPNLKYLGVWLDSHLTMDKHISSKCRAASLNVRCIANIRRFIDIDTAKMLATSMVLSHLDYSNSALCGLPKKALKQLQRIQNWAAKVVLLKDKYSSSKDALKMLHWLPIKERVDFKILCLVFKCLHDQAPDYLSSLLKEKKHQRTTRLSASPGIVLEVPLVRKSTFASRSFSVQGPCLWNALSSDVRTLDTLPNFKRAIKTVLFRRAFKLRN